jgi:hydroxyethylthiazole kinase-like uncharacterized protein yjeF
MSAAMNTVLDEVSCPCIDTAWLARHPLPALEPDGDKEVRGQVLVIAGSREVPGAAVLACVAALRSGAGKLTLMTAGPLAAGIGLAVPEARVVGSGLTASAIRLLSAQTPVFDAMLIGPGMSPERECERLAAAAAKLFASTPLIMDAAAIGAIAQAGFRHDSCLVTPHAGELAKLTGWAKQSILADPHTAAARAAAHWNVCVLLKGASTVLATPAGPAWTHDSRRPGLATSGSGDVLAGLIAGLVAQGADLITASAWAVAAHDRCGERLTASIGEVGYLARDILGEIPRALAELRGTAQREAREAT